MLFCAVCKGKHERSKIYVHVHVHCACIAIEFLCIKKSTIVTATLYVFIVIYAIHALVSVVCGLPYTHKFSLCLNLDTE